MNESSRLSHPQASGDINLFSSSYARGRWGRKLAAAFRRLSLHGVLILGALLFGLPFLWLLTTSFKEDTEVFSDPPKWIPMIPLHSLVSPFVDPEGSEPMRPFKDQPALVKRWGETKSVIQNTLWQRAQFFLRSEEWAQRIPGLPESVLVNLETPLCAALWQDVAKGMPDAVQSGTDQEISSWLTDRVGMPEVQGAWNKVGRILSLGHCNLYDAQDNPIDDVQPGPWRPEGEAVVRSQDMVLDDEKGLAVFYDLNKASSFSIVKECQVPVGASSVGRVDISYHSDKSWHILNVEIMSQSGSWVASKRQSLEQSTWQEWTYQHEMPAERDSLVVPLRLQDGPSGISDPTLLRVRMTVSRSSWGGAVLRKFWRNYREALRYVPFWSYAKVSVYLVIMNVVGQLLACSMVGYAFARLKWYGRDIVFMVLLSTMMIPGEVTMIPYFVIIRELGWYNTLKVLWVPAFFGTPFFIFLLRQFYMTIPKELEDAAKIDGCNLWAIYWRIMLPLVKPALATIAIFQFMGTWNDFMRPLIFINSEAITPLPLGLYVFRTQYTAEFGMMMAASGLMTVPVIASFFLAQKYFIQGVTLTGIKG